MNTAELIENFNAAKLAFDQAKANMAGVVAQVKAAQDACTEAAQALHDDLEMNGPALYVDTSTDPVTYYIYSADGPDDFTATPIRPAA